MGGWVQIRSTEKKVRLKDACVIYVYIELQIVLHHLIRIFALDHVSLQFTKGELDWQRYVYVSA